MGRDRRSTALVVAVAAVPFLALAAWFWFLCDDAYITFRFARNLARGYGIRYNIGDDPSEGYSNFLWLLLAGLFEVLGLDPGIGTNVVAVICGIGVLGYWVVLAREHLGVSRRAAIAGAIALAAFPPFDVWATSGLETMSFVLLVVAAFERLALGEGRWWIGGGVAMLLLSLSRTEGIFWCLVVLVVGGGVRYARKQDLRPFLRACAILLVPFVGYTIWRAWWFGSVVSNTALVKAHFGLASLVRGGKYLLLYEFTFVLWLPMLAASWWAIRRDRALGFALLAMALAFPAYGVLVGGDFMPMGRLFTPGLPFLYLLFAVALDRLSARPLALSAVALAVVVSGILPGVFDIHVVPQPAREALHFRTTDREFLSEYGRWANMVENTRGFLIRGRAIRDYAAPGERMVGQAVGAIGYESDLYIYDCYGLITREVAELPVDPEAAWDHSPGHDKEVPAEFFVDKDPDYLHMRVVQGSKAAILIKDSLNRWNVSDSVKDRYVPEFVEVEIAGEVKRSFLVMVRKKRPSENAEQMWAEFEEARIQLHRELKKDPNADGGELPATGDDGV